MNITKCCFFCPTSRSVNICSASKSWMIFDVGFFDFEKMTFLDIFDMHLIIFDINSHYLVEFCRYFFKFYSINEAHKEYSLLDTISNYIFYFGPPGKHLQTSQENLLHVGRLRGRHVVGFGKLSIVFVLEVQDKRYS